MTYAEAKVIQAIARRATGAHGRVVVTPAMVDKYGALAAKIRDEWIEKHGNDDFLPFAAIFLDGHICGGADAA